MSEVSVPGSSLRARKAARTRAALIDAAVASYLKRGYEDTTVDRIAAAVEVSPRTFSRYFPSKEAVFVAVLDDVAEEVAAQLWVLPAEVGPLAGMRAALGAVLAAAHAARSSSGAADRILRAVRVLTTCEPLRQAAIEYRSPRVLEAMAHRMNVAIDDHRLTLAMAVISVTVVHAWTVVVSSQAPIDLMVISEQVDRAFAEVVDLAFHSSRAPADHEPPD